MVCVEKGGGKWGQGGDREKGKTINERRQRKACKGGSGKNGT